MLRPMTGALLSLYSAVYAAQALFNRFYVDLLHPQEVWDVLNYITAVGILVIMAVAVHHLRSQEGEDSARRLPALIGLYAAAALAITYYPLWFSLIMGDAQSEAQNVGWLVVQVLNPILLAHTGRRLMRASDPG